MSGDNMGYGRDNFILNHRNVIYTTSCDHDGDANDNKHRSRKKS